MIFNLTKQLFNDFKFIYKINIITDTNIFSNIVFITILILKPYAILYSSVAKTLHITHLYLTEY